LEGGGKLAECPSAASVIVKQQKSKQDKVFHTQARTERYGGIEVRKKNCGERRAGAQFKKRSRYLFLLSKHTP